MTATATLVLVAGACGSDVDATPATSAVADTGAAPAATQPDAPAGPATSQAAGDAGAAVTTTAGTDTQAATTPEALQFTAPLLGGGVFDGAAYGERPVVFWFWAPT